MEKIAQTIINGINAVDAAIWGWPMIVLLLGTHLLMTVITGGIQKKIGTAIRLSFTPDPDSEGEVSQFGALVTALASTIGTGNIIGVGTAIVLGGPGAVLWCWLTGVFGIATKYAESLIAVKYRVKTSDGRMQGGAMYALERGLHMKWLGLIFAFLAAFASFGIGCATQVNAIATVCEANLGIPVWPIGLIVAIFLFSKREDNKAIAKLSAVPAIFGINEPMIFGMPIVLNPLLAIPFVLAPMITAAIGYVATATGFAGAAMITVPFTVPPIINAYLTTAGSIGAVITQIICIIVSILIYIPFVKLLNRQQEA